LSWLAWMENVTDERQQATAERCRATELQYMAL
jgi:hypothetical protein